jgi:hypothetical protein
MFGMANPVFDLQIDKNLHFCEYSTICLSLTLFFYRINNSVVENTIDIDRFGYAGFKSIFQKKYYFLLFLIYFCLHIYQNPRIHTSLIFSLTFSWFNHFSNELYATLEENDTYDLKKKWFYHIKTLLACMNKSIC